jgi:hypothetical protein
VTIGSVGAGVVAACALSLIVGLGSASEAAETSRKAKLRAAEAAAVTTAYSSSKSPATSEPQATGSVSSSPVAEEENANCTKSRKRLWVEGEGWIVRRVTTCF